MHLQQATAFADKAAQESQSRARAVDALSTRCDLATVLLRDASPEAAAKAVQAVLGAEKTLALALSLPESVGRDRATASLTSRRAFPTREARRVPEAMLPRV